MKRRVEDGLKGEHFNFAGSLFRRTEDGYVCVSRVSDGEFDKPAYSTEVLIADPINWHIVNTVPKWLKR